MEVTKSTVLCAALVNLCKTTVILCSLSVEFTGCKWHYLGYVVELCYYPHYFSMLVPTFRFFQLLLTVSRFFQLPELVSDCHSVYQQPRERKIFDFFVARVMQKLYSGNGSFSHILCSFLRAICRYIDRPERSRRNKMFQILVRGCRSSHA